MVFGLVAKPQRNEVDSGVPVGLATFGVFALLLETIRIITGNILRVL